MSGAPVAVFVVIASAYAFRQCARNRHAARHLAQSAALGHYGPMTPTNLLTTEQVAARAGKHVSTINRWAQNGRITPAIQLPGVTGDRLYDPEDEDVAALIHGDSNDEAHA